MGHGVTIDEVPTGVKPPVSISAGLPVYFGTAPINSVDLTNVNKPKLCETLADFVTQFGPLSSDFASWTLHEAATAHFSVYSVAPIVCINVLDPNNAYHVGILTGEANVLVNGSVQLEIYGASGPLLGILQSTVVVRKGSTLMTLGVDYTLAFDANGYLVVTIVVGGRLGASDTILVDFHYLQPSGVTANDVIGAPGAR